jgi:hypothetical protein
MYFIVGQEVEKWVGALCYKQEGRGFDSQWGHWKPHYGPGVDSSLADISTWNIPEDKERPVRKADNFTAICESIA